MHAQTSGCSVVAFICCAFLAACGGRFENAQTREKTPHQPEPTFAWGAFMPHAAKHGRHRVYFEARLPDTTVYVTDDGIVTNTVFPSVHKRFAWSLRIPQARATSVTGESRLPAVVNVFSGNDRKQWFSRRPLYRTVVHHELRPHMQLQTSLHAGRLGQQLVLQPDALESVRLDLEGVERVSAAGAEGVSVTTALGAMRIDAIQASEERAGKRVPLACAWRVHGKTQLGVSCGAPVKSKSIVLAWGLDLRPNVHTARRPPGK